MKIINGSSYEINRYRIKSTNMTEQCFNAYKSVCLTSCAHEECSSVTYCDSERDFRWYESEAKRGEADCQLVLFHIYRFGGGAEINFYKSVFWLKLSASGGNPLAMFMLGQVYLEGFVEEVDTSQALYWTKKAAHAGYSDAMLYMGFFEEMGVGVNPNNNEAYKWYLKASRLNNLEAHTRLAKLVFEQFADDEKYVKKAVYYLKRSIKLGNEDAISALGLYYKKIGGEYSKKAFDLLKKSADTCGDVLSALAVAEMYETGIGVKADADKALEYYNLIMNLI